MDEISGGMIGTRKQNRDREKTARLVELISRPLRLKKRKWRIQRYKPSVPYGSESRKGEFSGTNRRFRTVQNPKMGNSAVQTVDSVRLKTQKWRNRRYKPVGHYGSESRNAKSNGI